MNNCKTKYRFIRLYVLSHGYVAVVFHKDDIDAFGGIVIPLAFGSEISAHEAVQRMSLANPENTVVFAGGLSEFKTIMDVQNVQRPS
jgi:hypothetical protein